MLTIELLVGIVFVFKLYWIESSTKAPLIKQKIIDYYFKFTSVSANKTATTTQRTITTKTRTYAY